MILRNVPPLLKAHLDGPRRTICVILRIQPVVVPDYPAIGMTSLDHSLTHDLGDGPMVFHAPIGVELSNVRSFNGGNEPDNAELTGITANFDVPIPEEDITAGIFTGAAWDAYIVNYRDLSMGHAWFNGGEMGRMELVDGRKFVAELLGLTNRLSQSIIGLDSIYCRAMFGSQYPGTPDAEITERHPCTKNTTGMWVSGQVTDPGEEPQYLVATDLAHAPGTWRPAKLRWKAGSRNAHRVDDIEDHLADGVLVFKFPTMRPPAADDEFEIRVDCTKWLEGTNGCRHHHGPQAVLWYRGEPNMPLGKQERLNTPGAQG